MRIIDSSIYTQELILNEMDSEKKNLIKACKYANWHTYVDMFNFFVGCNVVKKYKEKYKQIKKIVWKNSLCAISAPINAREKMKGLLYFFNPYLAAKIINKFRVRKFTVEK